MRQTLGIELPQLLHAPGIELCAQARAQAPAHQVEPGALVLGRAPASLGMGQQRIAQRAQQRHTPALLWAEDFFQRGTQLAHVLGGDGLGLGTKNALNLCQSLGEFFSIFFGSKALW